MARKPEKEVADPVSKAFIEALKEHFRVKTHRALGLALGYKTADEQTTVGRWARGEFAPSFHHTIKILTAAGWLKPAALRAYGQAERRAATAEESEAALDRVAPEAPRPAGRAGRRRN